MAQSTILAAGVTAATSTDVVVAAGASVLIGVFSGAGLSLPFGLTFSVLVDTPDADNVVDQLSNTRKQIQIFGPGTFRVSRPAYTGDAFGVFLEA
jgi:hypothetical protein